MIQTTMFLPEGNDCRTDRILKDVGNAIIATRSILGGYSAYRVTTTGDMYVLMVNHLNHYFILKQATLTDVGGSYNEITYYFPIGETNYDTDWLARTTLTYSSIINGLPQ